MYSTLIAYLNSERKFLSKYLTAERVDSHTQVVSNIFQSFPITDSSINFKGALMEIEQIKHSVLWSQQPHHKRPTVRPG